MVRKIALLMVTILVGAFIFISLQKRPSDTQTLSVVDPKETLASIQESVSSADSNQADSQDASDTEVTEGTYSFSVKKLAKMKYPNRLSEVYNDLKSAADDGNLKAADVLASTLKLCQSFPRTQKERESYLQSEDMTIHYTDREKVVDICRDITDEQMQETLHYAQIAASENDVGALMRLAYTFDPKLEGKSREEIEANTELADLLYSNNMIRLDALERAAENGSVTSLATLASDYYKNRYSTKDNLQQARKYYQAYYLLTGSESIYKLIEATERSLSHDQIIESNMQAQNLINSWSDLNSIYK